MVSPLVACPAKPKTTENLLSPLLPVLEGQPASWCLFSSQVGKQETTETLRYVEPQLNFCCTIWFIQLITVNQQSFLCTYTERKIRVWPIWSLFSRALTQILHLSCAHTRRIFNIQHNMVRTRLPRSLPLTLVLAKFFLIYYATNE